MHAELYRGNNSQALDGALHWSSSSNTFVPLLPGNEAPQELSSNSVPLASAYGLARDRDGRWAWAIALGVSPSPKYQHAAVFVHAQLHVSGGALGDGHMVEDRSSIAEVLGSRRFHYLSVNLKPYWMMTILFNGYGRNDQTPLKQSQKIPKAQLPEEEE